MAASDEHPKHGEVLDEVLRDEIKDLPPEQIRQVLEYIGPVSYTHRAAEGAVTHPSAWAGSLIGGLPFVLHPEISGSERIL